MGHKRRRARLVLTTAVVLGVVTIGTAWMLRSAGPAASVSASSTAATSSPTAATTPAPTPTKSPTPTGYPANTATYDLGPLPQVNVFTVLESLPVDDDRFAQPTAETARPLTAGAPVWADPMGAPIAYLPRDYTHGGTTVPVVEKQDHWVKVLLVGRQAYPSLGDPSQVSGWLRLTDIELAPIEAVVRVSISDRTIDVVRGASTERIATDFAWGTDVTPTPLGRAFIMTTDVVPEYWYTRGHPIVYLSVQSPTLDGFGGADVAVTAFHYHDERSGPISNGCLRVDPAAIGALAALPYGTPVMIDP